MEKMQEYEVERIIDKKTTGRKEKKVIKNNCWSEKIIEICFVEGGILR